MAIRLSSHNMRSGGAMIVKPAGEENSMIEIMPWLWVMLRWHGAKIFRSLSDTVNIHVIGQNTSGMHPGHPSVKTTSCSLIIMVAVASSATQCNTISALC